MIFHGVLGGILHQATWIAYFVHHGVANIGARAAAYALVLQAFANVDACWADLNTQTAIDTSAQVQSGHIGFLGT
jgi:hypothetical protein